MNYENLAYLQDGLKYLGFGDNPMLMEQLAEEIEKQPEKLELATEACFGEATRLESKLYFSRSTRSDMYFFNKYHALLRYLNDPQKNKSQIFYISKGTGVSQKEAFNLLQGRAVYKKLTNMDGEKYNAWLQLNFDETLPSGNYKTRQFGDHYGYALGKVLEQYPIRELTQEDVKAGLIRSLQRGNVQQVHFVKKNKTEQVYIEANPRFKTINIYPVALRASGRGSQEGLPDEVPFSSPTGGEIAIDEEVSIDEGIAEMGGEEMVEMEETGGVSKAPEIPSSPAKKRVRK